MPCKFQGVYLKAELSGQWYRAHPLNHCSTSQRQSRLKTVRSASHQSTCRARSEAVSHSCSRSDCSTAAGPLRTCFRSCLSGHSRSSTAGSNFNQSIDTVEQLMSSSTCAYRLLYQCPPLSKNSRGADIETEEVEFFSAVSLGAHAGQGRALSA